MSISRFRRKVYQALEVSSKKYSFSWYIDLFLLVLISLNVVAILLETVHAIHQPLKDFFYYFDLFSVIIFSIEYALRIWSSVESDKYNTPIRGRINFALTPLAFIDLLAILPFYLAFLPIDLRFLRLLRLLRLLRVLKFVRYVAALQVVLEVLRRKKEQLVVSTIFAVFLLIFISAIMFHIENQAQPDVFSSIPGTMWWGVATLTTVGYGDVYPITPLGKFLGGIVSILGIGLFALPAGILASGFAEAFKEVEPTETFVCPNCGYDASERVSL
ncbi:MAG: ion transporter [Saprospiraceae bacterium]|nr:ion transporter [Saprospiraceae bacterium]